jgi:hypothetical protein
VDKKIDLLRIPVYDRKKIQKKSQKLLANLDKPKTGNTSRNRKSNIA